MTKEHTMDSIYQACAHDHTARQTADNFAKRWFDAPREVENFTSVTDYYFTFTLVNGWATYKIEYKPEIKLKTVPLWIVSRM